MAGSIRILIIDRDDTAREKLRNLLEGTVGITAIDDAADCSQALSLCHQHRPDVVLLDSAILQEGDLHAPPYVHKLFLSHRVIVLGPSRPDPCLLEAFRHGARGCLSKVESTSSEILTAIRAVSRGDSVLTPPVAGWILDELGHRQQAPRPAMAAPAALPWS